MRFWAKLKKHQKIILQQECEYFSEEKLQEEEFLELLHVVCVAMDVERPIVLQKHLREIEQFGGTRFIKDDFIEKIKFDWLEIEIVGEEAEITSPQAK